MAGAETTMPARAGTTTNKNQLLRVCDTPAADAYIRNPGYRPTYSCMLTRPMSARLREQARTSTQPLSGIFTVTDILNGKNQVSRVICAESMYNGLCLFYRSKMAAVS